MVFRPNPNAYTCRHMTYVGPFFAPLCIMLLYLFCNYYIFFLEHQSCNSSVNYYCFLQEKQALDKRIDELEEQTKVSSFVPITVLFSV